MAQFGEGLVLQHGDLHLILRILVNQAQPGSVDPSTGKVQRDGSWGLLANQSSQLYKFQAVREVGG